jgi:hypothetical protein
MSDCSLLRAGPLGVDFGWLELTAFELGASFVKLALVVRVGFTVILLSVLTTGVGVGSDGFVPVRRF